MSRASDGPAGIGGLFEPVRADRALTVELNIAINAV